MLWHFSRRDGLCDFPPKKPSSCIWVSILVGGVILHWYACGGKRPGARRGGGKGGGGWAGGREKRVDGRTVT